MKSSLRLSCILLLEAAVTTTLLALDGVDRNEARRFVGSDDAIRIDAQLLNPQLKPNAPIAIVFEIENRRNEPVAIEPTLATCDYDEASQTVTINVGAEVPDLTKPMKLEVVQSGQKKIFRVTTRLTLPPTLHKPYATEARYVQVKVNFLSDIHPFETLLVAEKKADAAIFPAWLEHNEAVVTNSVPFEFNGVPTSDGFDASHQSRGN